MRVFTAIELPQDVRERVFSATRELLSGLRSAKAVAAENLHVTVRFLGEVDEGALADVLAAAREAATGVTAGPAEVRGFGVFPNVRRPRILWAGIDDPTRVTVALEAEVSRRVDALGFVGEDRAFAPHVTVARLRDQRGWSGRRASAASIPLSPDSPAMGDISVDHLTVFASELDPAGARYTPLGRFPLAHRETP